MPQGAVLPDGAAPPGMELSLLDGSELAQFEDKEGSKAAVVYFVARAAFSSPPVNFTAQDVHVDNGKLPYPRTCRLASGEELDFRMLTVNHAGNWAPVSVYALFLLGEPFETLPANCKPISSGCTCVRLHLIVWCRNSSGHPSGGRMRAVSHQGVCAAAAGYGSKQHSSGVLNCSRSAAGLQGQRFPGGLNIWGCAKQAGLLLSKTLQMPISAPLESLLSHSNKI